MNIQITYDSFKKTDAINQKCNFFIHYKNSFIRNYILKKVFKLCLIIFFTLLNFIFLYKLIHFISLSNLERLSNEAFFITKDILHTPIILKQNIFSNDSNKTISYKRSIYLPKKFLFLKKYNNNLFDISYNKPYKRFKVNSSRSYNKSNLLAQNYKNQATINSWLWPTKSKIISSKFGYRIHPVYKIKSFHNGIDIKAPRGSFIYAPTNGYIESIFYSKTYGKVIKFTSHCGHVVYFAHLNNILAKRNSKVKKGSIIATVGSTGVTTGPHLHISIAKGNKFINPLKILKK